MERAVLHVVRPARKPVRAVLLAPGCNGDAKNWIQESAWLQFAERNGVLLAGLSFASSEADILAGKGYYETELGSGEILFRLLKKSGGGNLPLHVYGFSGGAHFTASLAERFPARVRSFCAFSAAWWSEITRREGVAHAVIACGDEDTRWYQQEEDTARYRTLVGTHQTWLVEWGTWGRLLYLSGWIMVFMICVSARKGRAGPVPLGVWFSWGIACIFSSVGEEWALWIIPVLCLVAALSGCSTLACRKIISHNMSWLLLSPVVLLLAAAWPREAGEEIFRSQRAVFVGKGERTDIWLMIDEQVLGNRAYAHALRRLAQESPWRNMRVGVIEEGSRFLPESPDLLLAAGDLNGHSWQVLLSRRPRLLDVLSPAVPPPSAAERGKTRLISFFGEFSRSSWLDAWKEQSDCRFLKGWGDYVPDLRPVLETLAGRDMP